VRGEGEVLDRHAGHHARGRWLQPQRRNSTKPGIGSNMTGKHPPSHQGTGRGREPVLQLIVDLEVIPKERRARAQLDGCNGSEAATMCGTA